MKAFKAMFTTTQEPKKLMLLNAIRLKYLFSITGDPIYAVHYKKYYDKYVTLYTPKDCKDIPKQKITEEQKDIANMLSSVTPDQQASLDDYIGPIISEDNDALRRRLYNLDTAAPPPPPTSYAAPHPPPTYYAAPHPPPTSYAPPPLHAPPPSYAAPPPSHAPPPLQYAPPSSQYAPPSSHEPPPRYAFFDKNGNISTTPGVGRLRRIDA